MTNISSHLPSCFPDRSTFVSSSACPVLTARILCPFVPPASLFPSVSHPLQLVLRDPHPALTQTNTRPEVFLDSGGVPREVPEGWRPPRGQRVTVNGSTGGRWGHEHRGRQTPLEAGGVGSSVRSETPLGTWGRPRQLNPTSGASPSLGPEGTGCETCVTPAAAWPPRPATASGHRNGPGALNGRTSQDKCSRGSWRAPSSPPNVSAAPRTLVLHPERRCCCPVRRRLSRLSGWFSDRAAWASPTALRNH